MIEGIEHIRDFRGIKTGSIEQFKKFNLLVGPNNSGKSAILEAIYLTSTASHKATLHETIQNSLNYCWAKISELDFLGEYPVQRVLKRHNYHINSFNESLTVDLNSVSVPLQHFRLEISSGFNTNFSDQVGLFSFEPTQKPQHSGQIEIINKLAYLILQAAPKPVISFTSKQVIYSWIPDLSYNNVGTSAWVIKGKTASSQSSLFYDVSNMTSHFPLSFFQKMVMTIPGWTQKIAESFGRVLGINKAFNVQFLPVSSQSFLQAWIAPADQTAITIDSYGDGARNAFKVLTPLLALVHKVDETNPGIFIWEEPGLFQNPQTLGLLLKEIATLVKNKPIQIFIATHSMEVVAYFLQLVEDGLIGKDELATIRMNLVDGKLSTSEFNYSEVEDWIEMRLDVRTPSGRIESPLIYSLKQTKEDEEND